MNTFQVLINSSRLPEDLALVHVACAVTASEYWNLSSFVFVPLQLYFEPLEMYQLAEGCFLCSDLLSERAVQSSQRLWAVKVTSNVTNTWQIQKSGHILESGTELDTMLTSCVEWQSDIRLIPEGHVWEPLCHCGWSSCSFLQVLATSHKAVYSIPKQNYLCLVLEHVSQGADLDRRFGKGKPGAEVTKKTKENLNFVCVEALSLRCRRFRIR